MSLRYYQPQFPFPQGSPAGPYPRFPGMGYYQPKFPYPQGASAGPYPRFPGMGYYEPKFPFPQGASAGPYPRFLISPGSNASLSGMGYRPNQGFYRGITPGTSRTLGQGITDPTSIDLTDPTTVLEIVGISVVALWLLKGAGKARRMVSGYSRRRRRRAQALAGL